MVETNNHIEKRTLAPAAMCIIWIHLGSERKEGNRITNRAVDECNIARRHLVDADTFKSFQWRLDSVVDGEERGGGEGIAQNLLLPV